METNVRRRVIVQLAGIVFAAIPVVAYAHGGNDDPTAEHACIGNVSRVVRIVGVSGACITSPPLVAEMPAHWNVQGPAGPRGATGANGTNGANGKDGKDGANGIDGTSVTFAGVFSDHQYGCPNGGIIFAVGGVNAIVCNGVDGRDGTNGKDGKDAVPPDGPCFDNVNRYVDCGNGTVTDLVTGLIWVQFAHCLGGDWTGANQAVRGLKDGDCHLRDGSSPGDWRLPTKAEWNATVQQAVALGCLLGAFGNSPSLTDDSGTRCINLGSSSFVDVRGGDIYWSSSTNEVSPSLSWVSDLFLGGVADEGKSAAHRAWAVRGGSR